MNFQIIHVCIFTIYSNFILIFCIFIYFLFFLQPSKSAGDYRGNIPRRSKYRSISSSPPYINNITPYGDQNWFSYCKGINKRKKSKRRHRRRKHKKESLWLYSSHLMSSSFGKVLALRAYFGIFMIIYHNVWYVQLS